MRPLSDQNIESELSYAYIHAVASHAGAACEVTGRHQDNAGVDATITAWGPFPGGGYRNEVDLKVQLKATVAEPTVIGEHISYSLKGIQQYDDLRTKTVATPRILVVLYLPKSKGLWLKHTEDALSLSKCAYWVSLRDAPASTNATAQTVYIPKKHQFDVSNLKGLFNDIASGTIPTYSGSPS